MSTNARAVVTIPRERSWRDMLTAEYEITQARLRLRIIEIDELEEYV